MEAVQKDSGGQMAQRREEQQRESEGAHLWLLTQYEMYLKDLILNSLLLVKHPHGATLHQNQ